MTYQIEVATLQQAFDLYLSIPEFSHNKSIDDLKKRLQKKQHLILVAKDAGEIVGFKMGYAKSKTEFYSWLGAVVPKRRGKGVAKSLLIAQEHWAKKQGFATISVISKNVFPAMLKMLISQDYLITGYDDVGSIDNNKIHFQKYL